MSVTLFCLTSECDFQFVQLPSASALNECPKCHGRAFSSEKGALGQHPYHTDDAECLVCGLGGELAHLRALLSAADDKLSEYDKTIVPNLRAEVLKQEAYHRARTCTPEVLAENSRLRAENEALRRRLTEYGESVESP